MLRVQDQAADLTALWKDTKLEQTRTKVKCSFKFLAEGVASPADPAPAPAPAAVLVRPKATVAKAAPAVVTEQGTNNADPRALKEMKQKIANLQTVQKETEQTIKTTSSAVEVSNTSS